jgi:ascorbate-specific PTS system EIIC-type component UlaA
MQWARSLLAVTKIYRFLLLGRITKFSIILPPGHHMVLRTVTPRIRSIYAAEVSKQVGITYAYGQLRKYRHTFKEVQLKSKRQYNGM